MCLAVPGKVIEVKEDSVIVDYISEKREAGNFINAKKGEYVIVQGKMAVSKVSKEKAENNLKELGEHIDR